MSILLDQCVPRKYLRLLRLAQELDAVLLTVDLDFSNILDYPPEEYAGLMVMRYEAKDETAVTATLQQALVDLYREDLRGALVIITPKRYRIRRSRQTAISSVKNNLYNDDAYDETLAHK